MSVTMSPSAGALYYPYIHIEDLNWLKANLVIFPFISRMVPMDFMPHDDEAITPFIQHHNGNEPLLRPANLWSDRALDAQQTLAQKLRRDARSRGFQLRYGIDAARTIRKPNTLGFQIHAAKLSPELSTVLMEDTNLAWRPDNAELYDEYGAYVEVHPRLGEAVMSTLAIACAKGEGLDIVGDGRSGSIRQCLLERDLDSVYETWLQSDSHLDDPKPVKSEQMFEFLLCFTGNMSRLTAHDLIALNQERESIDKLLRTLRDHASRIPTMDEGTNREHAFQQEATRVLEAWAADRQNLPNYFRNFFRDGLADIGTRFFSQIAKKVLVGMGGGAAADAAKTAAAAATSSSASWVGSLGTGAMIGAGAGLLIAILAHSGKAYWQGRRTERDSPYRFLTMLENTGVVFRTEVHPN